MKTRLCVTSCMLVLLCANPLQAAAADGYVTINATTEVYNNSNTSAKVQTTLGAGEQVIPVANGPQARGWLYATYHTIVQTSALTPGSRVEKKGWFRARDVMRPEEMPRLAPTHNKAWKPTYLCMMMTAPGDILYTQEFQFHPNGSIQSWVLAVAPDGRTKRQDHQGQAYLAGNLLRLVYADTATHQSLETYFGYNLAEGRIYNLESAVEQQIYKISSFQVAGTTSVGDSREAETRCTHRPR